MSYQCCLHVTSRVILNVGEFVNDSWGSGPLRGQKGLRPPSRAPGEDLCPGGPWKLNTALTACSGRNRFSRGPYKPLSPFILLPIDLLRCFHYGHKPGFNSVIWKKTRSVRPSLNCRQVRTHPPTHRYCSGWNITGSYICYGFGIFGFFYPFLIPEGGSESSRITGPDCTVGASSSDAVEFHAKITNIAVALICQIISRSIYQYLHIGPNYIISKSEVIIHNYKATLF